MSWLLLAYLCVGVAAGESVYRLWRRGAAPYRSPFWAFYLVAVIAWPVVIAAGWGRQRG